MNITEGFVIQMKDTEVTGEWISIGVYDDMETCTRLRDHTQVQMPESEFRIEHVVTLRAVVG